MTQVWRIAGERSDSGNSAAGLDGSVTPRRPNFSAFQKLKAAGVTYESDDQACVYLGTIL
jgi:hypothetical protein